MPNFLFSLETLLHHREGTEQKERDALFRLTSEWQMERNRREDLTSQLRKTIRDLSLKHAESADHQELTWFYLYLNRLNHEIRMCEMRLSQLRAAVQAQKEAVLEASRKRKILAAMKEKRQREYALALEKQEQKEIDDLVVARYATRESEYPLPATAAKSEPVPKIDR